MEVESVTSRFFAKRIVLKSNSTVFGRNISCHFSIAHSKSNFLLHILDERFLDLTLMWTFFLYDSSEDFLKFFRVPKKHHVGI